MSKWIWLLILLLCATGCVAQIDVYELDYLEAKCKEHKGVLKIVKLSNSVVTCQDGTTFPYIPLSVSQ